MAIYFYEERIYGSDASSYLFGVVNNEWFYTERGRIIIWLSQWFPLLAVWFGLPMKAVLITHSLGHVLFFYFIFLLGHFHFRKTHVGALILIAQTLSVKEAYFAWPYGEVGYGIGLTVLLILVTAQKLPLSFGSGMAVITISVFLVTGHPLVFPCLGLGLMFLFFRYGMFSRLVFSLTSITIVGLLRYLVLPSYDGQLADDFLSIQLISLPPQQEVVGLITSYPILWVALTVILINLLLKRRWVPVLLTVGSVILVSIVINRFAPLDGATQQYYQAYSGIFVMVMLLEFFQKEEKPYFWSLTPMLLVATFFASTYGIYSSSGYVTAHTQRLKTLAKNLSSYEGGRFIIKGNNMYGDSTLIWQSSEPFHEMLLLSALTDKVILLRVFERGMEYHNWTVEGTVPIEGPEDPRKKKSLYYDTFKNRALVSGWVHTVEPEFNSSYFPVNSDSLYRFLNHSFRQDSHVQNPKAILLCSKRDASDGSVLQVTICNEGGSIRSNSPNGAILRLVCLNASDTLTRPLTKDVIEIYTEVVYLPEGWCQGPMKAEIIHQGVVLGQQTLD
jgi:hypothetical protein